MKNRPIAGRLPSYHFKHFLSLSLLMMAATLWCWSINAFATTTYPPIDSFLWGNTAVNAIGQTSKVSGKGWGYRYLPPKNFDRSKKYPVIIFLHGMGENAKDHNSDNNAQLAAGNNTANGALALVSLENQDTYPVFFVAPQNASGLWGAGGPYLLAILNTLKTYYPNSIDEDRICLTGLSAGAFGTWDLPATTMPGVFSCLVPMSGGSGTIDKLQPDIPIWAFHAANDTVVGVTDTESSVNSWRNYGRKIIFTRYDSGNHTLTTWATGYQTPQLLPWMMAQRRGQPMTGPVDIHIKSVSQGGSKLSLAVDMPAGLTTSRVGWSSNFTTSAQSGGDGEISGATFTSATANFLNKPANGGRLAITYSQVAGSKTFNWKRYYDIDSIPSANTLMLTTAPSTAAATKSFTVYRQGKEENPYPGTGGGIDWTLDNIPLSVGFNLVHAYAELPTWGNLGGKTTVNAPYWVGYSTVSGDTVAPSVVITNPSTSSVSTSGPLDITGTASDAGGVTELTWSSDRGYNGTLSGPSWIISNVPLVSGSNRITITARDAKNNVGSATLTVNYTGISANRTPSVSAGAYQSVDWPNNMVTLTGKISDDGLPSASSLSASWSKVSGPGLVSFGNSYAASTTASLSQPGTYVLRLTASDTLLSASSDVVVTVRPNGPLVTAVDAGSTASYTAADGTVYAADTYCTASKTSVSASTLFAGTADQPVYHNWCYSNTAGVNYAIPIANGTYDVVLKFSETTGAPRIDGMRVFDVTAEGQTMISGLDILAQAGRLVAYDRVIRVTVSDSMLNLGFVKVVGAPTVSGIVVRNAQ